MSAEGVISRDYSLCGHTILEEKGPLVIKDLLEDNRFFDNPMLTNPSSIRFYAACRLLARGDLPVGTFCIMDKEPRTLSEEELKMLHFFSRKCMELIELKKSNTLLDEKTKTSLLTDTENELVINLLSNKILLSNESIKNDLDNLISSQPENSKSLKGLIGISKEFNIINSEINLIKHYLQLKEIGDKKSLSLEKVLDSSISDLPKLQEIVTLDKDEEFYGEQESIEIVLSSILKFITCKNQGKEIKVSTIKSESQTVIIINSDFGGFDKEEQKNLFTLNLELGAQYSPCKGMEIPLSKKIVRLHNGKIQIYSAENAGLSFFLSLPNS